MMRFKYSFTLWIEENGLPFFSLPAAIALSVVANEYNSYNDGLYYFINIVGFVIGYFAGAVTWMMTGEWMRKRTIWAGEWEDYYHKSIFPLRYDNSKIEESIEKAASEENVDNEKKWRDHMSFSFGETPKQKYFFLLVTLILLANEHSQFMENEIVYSARVFLDSSAFYIAFMYISKPVFQFTKCALAQVSLRDTFGSSRYEFNIFKVLIINSIIYGYAAYYSHQLFLTFK